MMPPCCSCLWKVALLRACCCESSSSSAAESWAWAGGVEVGSLLLLLQTCCERLARRVASSNPVPTQPTGSLQLGQSSGKKPSLSLLLLACGSSNGSSHHPAFSYVSPLPRVSHAQLTCTLAWVVRQEGLSSSQPP